MTSNYGSQPLPYNLRSTSSKIRVGIHRSSLVSGRDGSSGKNRKTIIIVNNADELKSKVDEVIQK